MNMFFRAGKVSGFVLIAGAVIGIIFALAGLYIIWSGNLSLSNRIFKGMDLLDRTLQTSSDGLVLIGSSIKTSQDTILVIRETSKELSDAAKKTAPMLDQMGQSVGQDMVGVVRNTQNSLAAAQSSAKLVDDTLSVVSSLPLIGKRYAPSQSLSDSLGQVSSSLNGLPDAFRLVQSSLQITSSNLSTVQKEMEAMQSNIDTADNSLQDAQQIVGQYQSEVKDLQGQVQEFQQSLPGWILAVKWLLTLVFVWMAVEQLALLVQGMEWVRLENSVETENKNIP